MDLIDDFINQYIKEYDYYDNTCRIASQQISQRLQRSGIRAIVTHRAKSPERLRNKLTQRMKEKKYKCEQDIYDDIVDFAGVRIALYFPSEITEVEKIIYNQFILLEKPIIFPGKKTSKKKRHIDSVYKKRFAGYFATHYRVKIKPDLVNEHETHYCDARIEIQVASVLMHAWSEVEHDLIYKPLKGELSISEYMILDELNGLVMSGELALERLQSAMDQRVKETERDFENVYELAAYILKNAKNKNVESMLGDVNVLFELNKELSISKANYINDYIDHIDFESDKRTISQQIIDIIIEGDSEKYKVYTDILNRLNSKTVNKVNTALGDFVVKWIEFESLMRKAFDYSKSSIYRNIDFKILHEMNILNDNEYGEFKFLRIIRNNIIHGIEMPDPEQLSEINKQLDPLIDKVKKHLEDRERNQ